eukprot:m.367036 g.367036  ORF g.367036 m.367036 type:complete len:1925 (-) comp28098_c0_seq1:460-6234(-)
MVRLTALGTASLLVLLVVATTTAQTVFFAITANSPSNYCRIDGNCITNTPSGGSYGRGSCTFALRQTASLSADAPAGHFHIRAPGSDSFIVHHPNCAQTTTYTSNPFGGGGRIFLGGSGLAASPDTDFEFVATNTASSPRRVGFRICATLPPLLSITDTGFRNANTASLLWGAGWTYAFPLPRSGSSGNWRVERVMPASIQGNVSFQLVALAPAVNAAIAGIYVDSNTGSILGQPPVGQTGTPRAALQISASGYQPRIIRTLSFNFQVADINVPARGPGGSDCVNGGVRYDGVWGPNAITLGGTNLPSAAVHFDLHFACHCSGGFTGARCQTAPTDPQLLVTYTGPAPPPVGSTVNFTDPTTRPNGRWAIGVTYRINAAGISNPRTTVGTVTTPIAASTLTYQLLPNPPGFFIDSSTGAIIGQPEPCTTGPTPCYNITSTLYASAPDTRRAVLTTIHFEILPMDTDVASNGPGAPPRDCENGGVPVDGVEFDNQFTCDCPPGFAGANCETAPTTVIPQLQAVFHGPVATAAGGNTTFTPTTRTRWAIGRTYKLNVMNVSSVSTDTGAAVSLANVSFQLIPNPPGFFIDGSTGALLGVPDPCSSPPCYNGTSTLFAAATAMRPAALTTIHFEYLPADVDVASNGPGTPPRDCENRGTPLDAVEFDNHFACDCPSGFIGDNCETSTAVTPILTVAYHGQAVPQRGSADNASFTPTTRTQWALGRTYRINVANVTGASTNVHGPINVSGITYQLRPNPPGFFIDGATGALLGQPTALYNGSSALVAFLSNESNVESVLENIHFEFLPADVDVATNGPGTPPRGCEHDGVSVDTVEFDSRFTCDCAPGFTGANCETSNTVLPQLVVDFHGSLVPPPQSTAGRYTPITRTQWAIGESYELIGVNVTAARTDGGTLVNMSAVTFQLMPNPPGWFLDGSTGAMFGRPATTLNRTSTLFASSPGTRPVALTTIHFEFLSKDTDFPDNGPGTPPRGCANGSVSVDAVEFDNVFTCDCTAPGTDGPNCEQTTQCRYGVPDRSRCVFRGPCPTGCACTATRGVSNHVILACTAVPTDAVPVGTAVVDLSTVLGVNSTALAVLRLPPMFRSTGAVLVAPSMPSTAVGGAVALASTAAAECPAPESDNVSWVPMRAVGPECETCDLGWFQNSSNCSQCVRCARGGFYAATANRVGPHSNCTSACDRCPDGLFSNHTNATGLIECVQCPEGTVRSGHAGFRACQCITGYARTDRFGACEKCDGLTTGIKCENEFKELEPGFFWAFDSENSLRAYEAFTLNLARKIDYNKLLTAFTGTVPAKGLKCPREKSCLGGVNSSCADGYEGPLCTRCISNYVSTFGTCQKCLSTAVNIVLLLIVGGCLGCLLWLLWVRPVLRRGYDEDGRPSVSRGLETSILQDHFQLVSQLITVFPFVPWGKSSEAFFSGTLYITQPFSVVFGLGCLLGRADAHDELIVFAALTVGVGVLIGVYYGVGRVMIARGSTYGLGATAPVRRIHRLGVNALGIAFKVMPALFVYLIQKAVAVLRPCRHVGLLKFTDDYSAECDASHTAHFTIAAFALVGVVGAVLAAAVAIKLQRRKRDEGPPSVLGTAACFLTEAYKPEQWYWRFVDFTRLVLLTSVIELVEPDTVVQLFTAGIVSLGFLQLQATFPPFAATTDGTGNPAINAVLYTYALTSVTLVMLLAAMLDAGHTDPDVSPSRIDISINVALIAAALLPYGRAFLPYGRAACRALGVLFNKAETTTKFLLSRSFVPWIGRGSKTKLSTAAKVVNPMFTTPDAYDSTPSHNDLEHFGDPFDVIGAGTPDVAVGYVDVDGMDDTPPAMDGVLALPPSTAAAAADVSGGTAASGSDADLENRCGYSRGGNGRSRGRCKRLSEPSSAFCDRHTCPVCKVAFKSSDSDACGGTRCDNEQFEGFQEFQI